MHSRFRLVFLLSLHILVTCLSSTCTFSAEPTLPPKVQWAQFMGQSGLRRIYATGGELGEMVNRQFSYQVAKRLDSSPAPLPRINPAESEAEGYVTQFDTLYPLTPVQKLPVFFRTLVRSAKRIETGKLHSRNDRIDLGVIYAPSAESFLSLGIGMENTSVDLKYVTGETTGFAFGPRLDAGMRLNNTLALYLRLEDLKFSGDNQVSVNTPNGPLSISRDIDNHRSFFQFESILRLTRQQLQWLPPGMQLGGMAGIHYLQTWHETNQNNLGQSVIEPFGFHERLGILRTGAYLSSNLGNSSDWNAYSELLFDYEFDNNLNDVIDESRSVLLRLSIARLFGPGKRLSLEYQGSLNMDGTRKRNNFVLSTVIDF